MRTHSRAHTGFTLIEVLVVVALLAALASVALPIALRHNPAAELDEAGRRLQSAVVLARAEAQLTAQVQRIIVISTKTEPTTIYLDPKRAPRPSEVMALDTRAASGSERSPAPAGRFLAELPERISIRSNQSESEGANPEDESPTTHELAHALPDGSVWLVGSPTLAHLDGPASTIALTRWGAKLTLSPIDPQDKPGDENTADSDELLAIPEGRP